MSIPDYRAPVAARPDSPVVLELRDVRGRRLRGLDLDVHHGEILGIAGLAGDGVLELPYLIAGHPRHPVTGTIRLPQRSSEWTDIADAQHARDPARAGRPRARRDHPRVRGQREPDAVGAGSPGVARQARAGGRSRELVERWTERLGIVTAGTDALISTLSGGNQQKVVVARCLAREPELLVLSEPTAGVDIGTRVAIYELIAGLARDGLTRDRVLLGPRRPARDVHADRRAAGGPRRRRARAATDLLNTNL